MTTTTDPCYDYDVSIDRREQILARLADVLRDVPGVVTFRRNDPTLPESTLPGILLLDADEEADQRMFSKGRPLPLPNRVTLSPEIHIVAQESPDTLGATLNTMAKAVYDAVVNDPQLISLCQDGSMEYVGTEMAIDQGRNVIGEVEVSFNFRYVLRSSPPCEPYAPITPTGGTTRERILSTIHQILGQVPGVDVVLRNDVSVPDGKSALILIDGSEDVEQGAVALQRPANSPSIVYMAPEVYIIAPGTNDAGQRLNEIRMMVIRYITHNPILRDLLYYRDLRYEGCQTAMALGRSITGEMGMVISVARVT